MLAHAQIVVGAPDGDLARLPAGAPDSARECADDPLQIGEDTIATFRMKLVNRLGKEPLIIHAAFLGCGRIINLARAGVHPRGDGKLPRSALKSLGAITFP